MFRPLISATTYRRAVFLLLGAVVALPYVLVGALIVGMFAGADEDLPGIIATGVVAAAIAAVPPFLGGTRELEIAAARSLLGVDLPAHDRNRPMARETRVRAALWFGLHLLSGVVIGAGVLIAVPLAVLSIFGQERLLGPVPGVAVGVALAVVTLYVTAGLGSLAATMAPVLLGPSPAERVAHLEAQERRLAERNRLARELHDSVGHALTAVTLQAGAARTVFDSDLPFARQALENIEELGRTALEELDAVLGLLRDAEAPTLRDLDRLLTAEVDSDVGGVDVPEPISREAYRIVQETLTNAAKHGRGRTRLRITVEDELVIEVSNQIGPSRARTGGRGLAGMRERVRLLGGDLQAGAQDGVWRVVARLPNGGDAG
ncbi:histidine kinase [Actinoplanes sp. Pm04-4]|uniref:histidine kinase n=1 Tax=Paractinoplanes pyxinae TaxID=2997416 RepID=A0ABT4AZ91_9ACTN|nr:histidine kinase [Actinoplanes pyxinae]MCY1139541.1 histidine kinase [Actinoplanes pyxinae]